MKQLKPFNLEQALAGAPVIMRDGSKVGSIVSFANEVNQEYSIVAVVQDCVGKFTKEGIAEWGIYYDLFMEPTKKEGWIVMCHNNSKKDFIVGTKIWASKQDAEIWAKGCEGVFAIAKIEWEE